MERKTKIVCTIGPASESEAVLEQLIDAGMNVARLNFSHATYEEATTRYNRIREVSQRLGKFVGILLDTKGPEIRCGKFENGGVDFQKGDIVTVVVDPVLGNKERFHIDCKELFNDIKPGHFILIDDGKIRLNVLSVEKGKTITCQLFNTGRIKNNKGVNVPGVRLSMPFISEKDRSDIIFGAQTGFDMIALSFVRRRQDVLEVKKILKEVGNENIDIIAKIENQEGMDNLEDILSVVDGVMVARGDLGVEVSTEYVPLYQKKIIQTANAMGKPVITATHMLESMTTYPRPTRAEASDVANAILDGTDAIMLSGETANGDYPVEAVKTMDTIARAIEPTLNYDAILDKSIHSSLKTINDAIGVSVSQSALLIDKVKLVVAFTETGGTAKRLVKFRPSVPVVAVTDNLDTCRRLTYYNGVIPIYEENPTDYVDYDKTAKKVAKKLGYKSGDYVIITSGWAQKHGTTNTLRIIEI